VARCSMRGIEIGTHPLVLRIGHNKSRDVDACDLITSFRDVLRKLHLSPLEHPISAVLAFSSLLFVCDACRRHIAPVEAQAQICGVCKSRLKTDSAAQMSPPLFA